MTEPYVIIDSGEDHEGWLEARRALHTEGYVGASDVSAIMGVNPYRSPVDWYLERVGERPHFEGNAATRRGQRYERTILEHGVAEGLVEGEVEPFGKLLRSVEHPLAATPDAHRFLDGRHHTVQVKDTRQVWDEEEGPPLMYQVQVQAELIVTGWDGAVLLADMGNKELRAWEYPRHDGAQAAILEAVGDALRRVRELDPPELEPTADNLDHFKKLHARASEREVALPQLALEKDRALQAVKAQIRKLEKERKELEAWFWDQMRDAQRATLPGGAGSYTLREQTLPQRTLDAVTFRVLRRSKK